MKKIISIVITVLMLVTLLGVAAFAATDADDVVYVSISDGNGIVVANEAVSLSSLEKADVEHALKAVHEKHGKTLATAESTYGPMITALWSVENGGAYGYYINNASAWNLADELKAGDTLYAFVYSDATYYSDVYSFFSSSAVSGKKGETVEVTLTYYTYDADWNLVSAPLAGATLTLDGEALDVKTDASGKATVKLTKSGTLSAKAEGITLVPPVCVVTVKSGCSSSFAAIGMIPVAICAMAVVIKKKK